MRRYILTLLTVLSVLGVSAQKDTLRLGFCNGAVATASDYQIEGEAWTQCAVRVPASSLQSYAGNSLVGLQVGLVARTNTDTLRVWVRSEKDGPNLATGYVVRQGISGIKKGWNRVAFNAPYALTAATGDLYIGYSLHQKGSVKAVSVVTPGVDSTSFIKLGNHDWQDISADGILSVEALVSGDGLADYDLGLGAATVSPIPSVAAHALRFTVGVHNYGRRPVTGFTVEARAEGVAPLSAHIATTVAPEADSTVTFTLDPQVATDEQTAWTLTLTGIDEAADGRESNNTSIPAYRFQRNVLVEEFTTEYCGNCPRVAGFLHTLLAQPRYAGRVNVVAHHSGYNTDWLTLPCDEELLWLYNGDGEYAPALAYDRQPFFDGTYTKNIKTVVHSPNYIEEIQSCLNYELAQPANAMVDVTTAWDNDSTELTVTVTGIRNSRYQTVYPRLNIFLLENDIKARNQSNASNGFLHQHVTRDLNATWGEPVEWNGRRFTVTKTFAVSPSWTKAKLQVLAFLYNYDAADATNCAVDNSVCRPVGQTAGTLAVHDVKCDAAAQPSACYDMSGRRVGTGMPGLTLVRMTDGTVRKVWRR